MIHGVFPQVPLNAFPKSGKLFVFLDGVVMNWKLFVTTFLTIFLAELGDKTQLATFSFAAGTKYKLTIFFAASCALILTSAIGVLLAGQIQKLVSPKALKVLSGGIFIVIGLWIIIRCNSQ